jgi:hypothetical protein
MGRAVEETGQSYARSTEGPSEDLSFPCSKPFPPCFLISPRAVEICIEERLPEPTRCSPSLKVV